MITIPKLYRCIFCGRLKKHENSYYNNERIGLCHECFSKLELTPKPFSFEGTRGIDYLVSPIFYSGKIRNVIIDYKFHGNRAFSDILSYLLCDLTKDMIHLSKFDIVIPVPISKHRYNERGYNQAALLAKPFAKYFNVPYSDDILLKIKETKRQSRISRAERFTNVQGAFKACENLTGRKILLIDDIYTTGGTMSACADALISMGAKNIAGVSLTLTEKRKNIFNIMY